MLEAHGRENEKYFLQPFPPDKYLAKFISTVNFYS